MADAREACVRDTEGQEFDVVVRRLIAAAMMRRRDDMAGASRRGSGPEP
jgi:hypothetical protein